MKTATVHANGINIAFDAFGDDADPPVVLVMGLGTQRLAWSDEFCEQLADAGRYVIRFDNRDVGESTHFPELGLPTLLDVIRGRPPYTLDDMADDLIGLLDALSIHAAHIVGVSLGGFIAQTAAVRAPGRVRTLSLIMTSTGSRRVGWASPRAIRQLLRQRDATDREMAIAQTVATFKVIGSPGYPFDEEHIRERAGASYDRAYDPGGHRRQLAAILSQPDRTARLRNLQIPTLVIHGLADPLVSPTGGLALARAIPGAKFIGFAGMGHDLPRPLWSPITNEIIDHTEPTPAGAPVDIGGATPTIQLHE
jgi:pimeloyl-ACP methyl ester carboxylesterase